MGFFGKKKRYAGQGRLTDYLSGYLAGRQRRLADWLNLRTTRVSRARLLYGLVVFCLLFGGYLICVLWSAFS